ncbi:hypothetical protein D0T49_12960 [Paludibacter sp. 221]|nr:hypothetical protein [Paludibacter sp. 221]
MNNNFLNEYIVCLVANVSILDKIFTLDFLTTIIVLISQFFISAILKMIFEFINTKIKKRK